VEVDRGGVQVAGEKPVAKLIGTDGNIFAVLGVAREALRHAGQHDKARELGAKVMSCGSYDEALVIIMDYVDVQ
jgi:hypothetical protein